MKERLQKLIAACGLASRREAERWIEAGRVAVDGVVSTLGDKADPLLESVTVDGKAIGRAETLITLLLNKPVGYVTTMSDPEGRPVVSALMTEVSQRVVPVGRLDLTTEGLLLMTNDGELAQRLAHPRFHVEKKYLARVHGLVDAATLRRLATGVKLEDGMTAAAQVRLVRMTRTNSWVELTLHEGRNRQVRRMFEALGYPVSRLKRIGYAFLEEGALKPGEYRRLTSQEVERLKTLGGVK
jgi:23S rRNA pseudouridine2605 synthase